MTKSHIDGGPVTKPFLSLAVTWNLMAADADAVGLSMWFKKKYPASSLWNELIPSHLNCANKSLQADGNGVCPRAPHPPLTRLPGCARSWQSCLTKYSSRPRTSANRVLSRPARERQHCWSSSRFPPVGLPSTARDTGMGPEESSLQRILKTGELCQRVGTRAHEARLQAGPRGAVQHRVEERDRVLGKGSEPGP